MSADGTGTYGMGTGSMGTGSIGTDLRGYAASAPSGRALRAAPSARGGYGAAAPTVALPSGLAQGDRLPWQPTQDPEPPAAPAGSDTRMIPVRGPRHARHMLEAAELDALALPVGDDGVVIGTDAARQPAVIALLRPQPVDAMVVGGAYLAQLLALRAAATGARIVVETARPELWAPLAQNAGGGQQVVALVPVRRVGPLGASSASPVLLIRDCGARPPRLAQPKTPWQTTMTLLPYLDGAYAGQLVGADLVALQRMSPDETQLASRVVRLGTDDVQSLPVLPDEVTLWCARQGRQYVYGVPTQLEAGLLGSPRRFD